MGIFNTGAVGGSSKQTWRIKPNVWWGEQVSMDEVDEADEAEEADDTDDIDDGWVKPTIMLNILEVEQ